ncbi:TauD/TfdA family dioxygenase [Sorangium sp. So ce362]|uniref:TauD/TfdA family dioxygenase n=1 Tax=Sorangium sp. So ce362 TaxID=3133303 RepID=UPI003F62107F
MTTRGADRSALDRARRRPVTLDQIVELIDGADGAWSPALARPAAAGVDLAWWLSSHRDEVERRLDRAGAVLFRGFAIPSADQFRRVVEAGSRGPLVPYTYASTDRRHLGHHVYTSTEYPRAYAIPLHNELSYAADWPMRLWFWCEQPPEAGGATPLADARRVHARLPRELVDRFERRGVQYVRRYRRDLDLPWQQVFATEDRDEVARFCARAGIEHAWMPDGSLRTSQARPAVASHPRTGEAVWFNQAHLFHPFALPSQERLALASCADEAPRTATHAGGAPIDVSDLEAIADAYAREAARVPWRAGDVLLLDNMLVAHGRDPFEGPRRILVAMTEMRHGRSTIEAPGG